MSSDGTETELNQRPSSADPGNVMLLKGQKVKVIGHSSSHTGHLLVSYHGAVLHVPHQVTELQVGLTHSLKRRT